MKTGRGQHAVPISQEMYSLFKTRCSLFDIPVPLALAIAKQESSFHPWAVNIGGKTYYPKTKKDALALAHRAMASGKSFDIGIVQVNSWWLRHLKLKPEQVIEPEDNILLGMMILANEIKKYGMNTQAIGAYHSKNPTRSRNYARKIIKHLQAIMN